MASNYDSVIGQIRAGGLDVDVLEVGRLVRCRANGDSGRTRNGWYSLHEITGNDGSPLLVGAFGDWRLGVGEAGRPQYHKISIERSALSNDAAAAIAARIKSDRKRAEAVRAREQELAARHAQYAWSKALADGHCAYLDRKHVGAHGVRFSAKGNLVIPICDNRGMVRGLQIIYGDPAAKKSRGRDKDYWPRGLAKRGNYHLIGAPSSLVLIAEGYATAASVHECSGLPVAVAFDAGNLLPVAQELAKRYKRAKILVVADDDYQTAGNPGVSAAQSAALAVGGQVFVPAFRVRQPGGSDPPVNINDQKLPAANRKLTDANDLAVHEGPHVLRAQIEARLGELNWIAADGRSFAAGGASRGQNNGAEGESANGALKIPRDTNDLIEHFAKVYGTEMAWDGLNNMVVKLAALRTDVPNKECVREWQASAVRRMVRLEDIGFDPSGLDPSVLCNLWTGFQTAPRKGACDRQLELLRYLCGNEIEAEALYQWILKWIAYPLQHPGAKMQTALLIHGEEGSGKNLFFGSVRTIYGRYGGSINQDDLEDKFNDWASAKLFVIANEVVTRVELYHVQGKLKNMITEGEWMINPKNMPRRAEQNHANFVFFSNRVDIAKLDKKDRRYCVVWTPGPLGAEFYSEVADELRNGGSAALHHHLLNLDLGDFGPHTKPPDTAAKRDLVDLGLDNTERFYQQWIAEELDIPVLPCLSTDCYTAYKRWAQRNGIPKYAPAHIFLATLGKRLDVRHSQDWLTMGQTQKRRHIVYPSRIWDPPDGQTRQSWLSDCCASFSAVINKEFEA